MTLKAPFPWFGGKSRVASEVWARFGDVPNYVEPFFGSGAVLLGRPHEKLRTETVNDKDCYLANLWRALQADPDGVASYARNPVNEADLHARHLWLVNQGAERIALTVRDPDFYDVKVAGWWVWGICLWIGGDWCSGKGPLKQDVDAADGVYYKRPHLAGERGIYNRKPYLDTGGRGVTRRKPSLWNGGRGVNRSKPHLTAKAGVIKQRPHLTTPGGVQRRRPYLADDMHGLLASRGDDLEAYLGALSQRLRKVRVCCGDWSRVVTPSVTTENGLTGVFLDPPYAFSTGRDPGIYNEDSEDLSVKVREWAIAHGQSAMLRIALCGYDGEHDMPSDWECMPWKAHGGYANRTGAPGRERSGLERIWFSPHCLRPAPRHYQIAFDLEDHK
ncbi:MAG: DNA adenine methylase [Capsulimonas sp.]|uniref:DNA adenine methylase n=1 Tax=Capsulimonas sp. TaxID=2494211 RepID=UPI003263040C